jgi:hypothetical protein
MNVKKQTTITFTGPELVTALQKAGYDIPDVLHKTAVEFWAQEFGTKDYKVPYMTIRYSEKNVDADV